MLWFHGIGESGTNVELLDNYGPLYYAKDAALGVPITYAVLAIQLPSGSWTAEHVKECLEYLRTAQASKIDFSRIYLSGCSWGGGAVWGGMLDTEVSRQIAAFVPICCVKGATNPQTIADTKVPGWAFHAQDDPTVSSSITITSCNNVNALAGYEQIKKTIYGGSSHAIWNKVFKEGPQSGFTEWLNAQRRADIGQPTIEYVNTIQIIDGSIVRFTTLGNTYEFPIK
jgi:predicted peptidase